MMMINMTLHLQGLRSDPRISSLVVKGKSTGKHLGTGSFGSVEEIDIDGEICAGKKIHEILLEAENEGAKNMVEMFVRECQLMSGLRHPNITRFLGLCFLPNCQLPILVMEKLNGSLDCLLESSPGIPLALKLSILEDVAKGLLYLHQHNPQIIHRDLTARNVLLTSSLVAKITDFGNSRFVNFQSGKVAKTLTRYPGTLDYMPPEARKKIARYGPSLDIFSFGHLALFVGLQEFPSDMLESTYEDPTNPEATLGRSEVERRSIYFGKLEKQLLTGKAQPLIQLIKQCLMNNPSRRPTTEQLLSTLEGMRADIERPEETPVITRAEAVRQVMTLWERDAEVKEKTKELKISNDELRTKVDQCNTDIIRLQTELQDTTDKYKEELCQMETEVQQKNVQIEKLKADNKQLEITCETNLRQKEVILKSNSELQQKLQQLTSELKKKNDFLGTLEEQFQTYKNKSISRIQRRNVLLLGRTGSGKSTLGNQLIDHSNILEGSPFQVCHTVLEHGTTKMCTCTTLLVDKNTHYIVQVVDTPDPIDYSTGRMTLNMKSLPATKFNLVLFVFKLSRWTAEDQKVYDFTIRQFSDELSSIFALIFTGGDNVSDKKREDCIIEFIKLKPTIAEFMKKGIHIVGFPDMHKIPSAFQKVFEGNIKADQEYLRRLVYSCEEMKQVVKR